MVKRKFSLSGPGKNINLIKGPLGVLIAIKLCKAGEGVDPRPGGQGFVVWYNSSGVFGPRDTLGS